MFIVARNISLKSFSYELMNKLVSYMLDTVISEMPPHLDNMIIIIDCYKFGYKNWS